MKKRLLAMALAFLLTFPCLFAHAEFTGFGDVLLSADYKEYLAGEYTFGIGDVYTNTVETMEALTAEIAEAFPSIYAESKLDMLFCMISTDDMTRLIWYGEDAEKTIAESFPDYDGSGSLIFTPKASRKSVIVPPLTKTLENWPEAAR